MAENERKYIEGTEYRVGGEWQKVLHK